MNVGAFNSYYNDFVFELSKSLRPGWGIEMRIYPFPKGAVVLIRIERCIAHRLERKGESDSLGNALRKTKIFSEDKIRFIEDKSIERTVVGIRSTQEYVLFKPIENGSWEGKSAQNDVNTIREKVKEIYEKG